MTADDKLAKKIPTFPVAANFANGTWSIFTLGIRLLCCNFVEATLPSCSSLILFPVLRLYEAEAGSTHTNLEKPAILSLVVFSGLVEDEAHALVVMERQYGQNMLAHVLCLRDLQPPLEL